MSVYVILCGRAKSGVQGAAVVTGTGPTRLDENPKVAHNTTLALFCR